MEPQHRTQSPQPQSPQPHSPQPQPPQPPQPESPQPESPEPESPEPESHGRLSRSETKLLLIQALGGEEIEPNIYRLTKPYFETYHSIKDNDFRLYSALKDSNFRFDYCDGLLSFKISSPQTECFSDIIGYLISSGLLKIEDQSQDPETIELAESIHGCGAAEIRGGYCAYQPSKQFRLSCNSVTEHYPGVVIEVGWSRPWKVLETKMNDLLDIGGGKTRVVIGVELEESAASESAPIGLKVLLSVWRLVVVPQGYDNVAEVVWDRVQIIPGDEPILRLTLRDFISPDTYIEYFPRADLDTEILIPLRRAYENAERGFRLWLRQGKPPLSP